MTRLISGRRKLVVSCFGAGAGLLVAASVAYACVSHGTLEANHKVFVLDNTNTGSLDPAGESVCSYHLPNQTKCPAGTTVIGPSVKAQKGDAIVSDVSGASLGTASYYIHFAKGTGNCGGTEDGVTEFEFNNGGSGWKGPAFVARWSVPNNPNVAVGDTWVACATSTSDMNIPFTDVSFLIVS